MSGTLRSGEDIPEEKTHLLEGHEPDPDVTSLAAEKEEEECTTTTRAPPPPSAPYATYTSGFPPNPMPLGDMGGPPINPNNVPNPATFWQLPDNQRSLLIYLGMSVWMVTMTFGVALLIITMLAGVIGAIAAFMHFQVHGAADLKQKTNAFSAMIGGALALDILAIVQLILVVFLMGVLCEEDPEEVSTAECELDYMYTGMTMLLLCIHTWMSVGLLRKARTVQMMLNPVSSGMVA